LRLKALSAYRTRLCDHTQPPPLRGQPPMAPQESLRQSFTREGGLGCLVGMVKNMLLSRPVRENALKLGVLLLEDFLCLEELWRLGALGACCPYLQPNADANLLAKRLAHVVIQALFIVDGEGGERGIPLLNVLAGR
jgi:hypothetical protein